MLSFVAACELRVNGSEQEPLSDLRIDVERYDQLECRYLTTGDFSALQKMNTDFPDETRLLVENILQLGSVDEHDINERFLKFFQDSTLLALMADVESQYANMDDINRLLTKAFTRLRDDMPDLPMPMVYAQVGALCQSIVISGNTIGISLDKYLGKDYSIYQRYYEAHQRETMTRKHIVPECIIFYLLSFYQLPDNTPMELRDLHMGRIMWVANKAMGNKFFNTPSVDAAAQYVKSHPNISIKQLLQTESILSSKSIS